MMDLNSSDIDVEQLDLCRSGDRLNLWLSPDQSFVNAYRRGSGGGQGRVATFNCGDNPALLGLMTEGRVVSLTVEFRSERSGAHTVHSFAFVLHTIAAQEARTAQEEALAKRKKQLLAPSKPTKPIVSEIRAPEEVTFRVGQQLTFRDQPVDHYARSPLASLEFIIGPNQPLALLRANAEQRMRMLRAHFSGFTLHVQVSEVSPEPVYSGDGRSTWKEACATVQVSFTK